MWHCHTHTEAYPSPTDVRQAVDPAWFYVIVSLRDQAPVLRAYRIRDGEIAEVAVELDRSSSTAAPTGVSGPGRRRGPGILTGWVGL